MNKTIWTYDTCLAAAKKCSSKTEFITKYPGARHRAYLEGWMNDYSWFVTPTIQPHIKNDYVVYSYEDIDNKTVYVGLTVNIKTRHRCHKNGEMKQGKRVYDTLAKYYQSINKEIPFPTIKMNDLSATDAQYYENWYIEAYKKNGWNVLNICKTGEKSSSIGGTYLKWTYDECKKEADKYARRTDFQKNSGGAYSAAYKYGWLDDFFEKTQHKKGYWTKERCFEIAKECRTRNDFNKINPTAYNVARINKWNDEFFKKKKG